MTDKRRPWMKWYPADWRSDEGLRNCGLAARGLWVELLCLAHKAEPYGHVLINGRIPTSAQLAIQCGCSAREIEKLIAELETHRVFSMTLDGGIFSRRMVRDNDNAIQAAEFGRGGGNPKLKPKDKPRDKGGVNPPDNGGDKAQMPEAIFQPEAKASGGGTRLAPGWQPDSEAVAFAAEQGFGPDDIALIAEKFRDYWHAVAGQRGRKTDWLATWRNWVRGEGNGGKSAKSGRIERSGDSARDAEIRRRRAISDEAMASSCGDGSIEAALRRDDDGETGYHFGRA